MMRRIKLVASVLALAIAASPLLAAVPCQQAAETKMQCGADCPMMAKASNSKAIGAQQQSQSTSATPSCCQKSSQPAAPSTTQAGPERPLYLAIQSISATSLAVVPQESLASVKALTASRVVPRSQATLCTFLI